MFPHLFSFFIFFIVWTGPITIYEGKISFLTPVYLFNPQKSNFTLKISVNTNQIFEKFGKYLPNFSGFF
jgi:hypothetical protein